MISTNQSWALLLQVAIFRYLANREKVSDISDLKNNGIAVAFCKVSLLLLCYCSEKGEK
jgi:hypothetical protein